jgi:hypothetical protein
MAAVIATAWLVAASLRLTRTLDFLLAAYLAATAEILVVSLALSPGKMFTRGWLLAFSALVLVAAALLWNARGRPRPPSMRQSARHLGDVLRDPVVAVPAAVVSGAVAYLGVLAIATPPNSFDVLWYHFPRAAFWAQQHAVGYVPQTNDLRLDVFPPAAEIVSAWAMLLAGNERFASLFQLLALVATMLAICGIARRIGLERRDAVFGSLLFATLPVVLLQASTALNDVVLASFVVLAVHFLLADSRTGLALGSLSLALAMATKPTALLALVLLLVMAAVLAPPRRWIALVIAGLAGIAVGGFWYGVNRVELGSFIPRFAPSNEMPSHAAQHVRIPAQLARLAIDAIDPAGAVGRDRYLYAVAAALIVAGALIVASRRNARGVALVGILAGALVLVPIGFHFVHEHALDLYRRALDRWGEERLAMLGTARDPVDPSPFVSWYGPLGLLAFPVAVVLAVMETRRKRLRWNVVVLALAPLLYMVIIALGIGYSEFHGRYLMPAVALGAVTWGLLARIRALAWAAVAIAITTAVLAVVHYREKPAGFAVLGGQAHVSIWSRSRLEAFAGANARGGSGPLTILEQEAWPGDTVALRIRQDDVSYPYFGADLDRRVVFVAGNGVGLSSEVEWLVVAPGLQVPTACPEAWRSLPTGEPGWRLYRRVGVCPGERASS